MVAVSKVIFEYAFIYHGTTNHKVFSNFIEFLLTQLKKGKKFWVDNSMFLFDRTEYYKTNSFDILLKSHKAIAIIGMLYTPEFTFVEFFNNYVKSKLRMNGDREGKFRVSISEMLTYSSYHLMEIDKTDHAVNLREGF